MIQTLQEAAEKAGEMILTYFRNDVKTSYKDSKEHSESLVTQADIQSQNIIQEIITNNLIKQGIKKEDIGFIGEENVATTGKHTFIIDPLDGTTNYAAGIAYFCISIGYLKNNQILCGVIYNPIEKTFYLAEKGRGAYKITNNGKTKLSIKPTDLKKAIVATHYNSKSLDTQFHWYQNITPHIAATRNLGSLTLDLCLFSENILTAVINGGCFIWDIAAAKLIIEESGGAMLDWEGNPIALDLSEPTKHMQIIAGEKALVDQLLTYKH